MEKPAEVKREIFRYRDGQIKRFEDTVVTEHPVTIKINQQEFATMVCTPEYVEDMAVGFWYLKASFNGTMISKIFGFRKKKALFILKPVE